MSEEANQLIERMGARAREMADKVQQVSGTGSDDDELVTATCGPGNRLTAIEFDPRSRRLDTHVLSEKVLSAVQRAGEAAQRELNEIISSFSQSFGGPGTGEVGNLQQSMEQAQAKIAEHRATMEELYKQLKD